MLATPLIQWVSRAFYTYFCTRLNNLRHYIRIQMRKTGNLLHPCTKISLYKKTQPDTLIHRQLV